MKTKNGIELNLNESEYFYNYNGYVFYFSSQIYRNKFAEQIESYIKMEQIKINNKYKVKIDMKKYLAIALYKRIEKRGFYIEDYIVIPENIEFGVHIEK